MSMEIFSLPTDATDNVSMMRLANILLSVFWLLLLAPVQGFGVNKRLVLTPSSIKNKAINVATATALIIPRGGAAVAQSLPPLHSTLAHISSVLGISNGLMYLFFTERLEKTYGSAQPSGAPKNSYARYMKQAIGAVTLGQGLSLHMVLIRQCSPLTAIGVALVPRLLLSYYHLLVRSSFGSPFLYTNTLLMTWVSLSLLTGIGNSGMASKIFTTFAICKGLLLALAPTMGAMKFFQQDISDSLEHQVVSRNFGEHLTYTAAYMATLAYMGTTSSPATAAGVAAAVWAGLLATLHHQNDNQNRAVERVYFGVAVLLAVGFLWPVA